MQVYVYTVALVDVGLVRGELEVDGRVFGIVDYFWASTLSATQDERLDKVFKLAFWVVIDGHCFPCALFAVQHGVSVSGSSTSIMTNVFAKEGFYLKH
jgi:hypothetical protein